MNYTNLILHFGTGPAYLLVFTILFAECGILLGFFLPGDTLLFALGLLASQGSLSLFLLLLVAPIGAILGNTFGYFLGRQYGGQLFDKKDSAFFNKNNVKRAEKFFEQYGKLAIVVTRFIPIVRTFTPVLAGVGHMSRRFFTLYNVIGGVLWTTLLLVSGYYLGHIFPHIDRIILPVIFLVILVSIASPFLEHAHRKISTKRKNG